jgi:hypothetical protein
MRTIAISHEVRESRRVRVERKATTRESDPVAGLRERGTSFSQSYDYAAEARVIDLAMDASTISWSVDDAHAQIDNGVDFSVLFVVESNPATASVPSLTDTWVGG